MSASESDDWKEGINLLRMTAYAELLKRRAESGVSAKEFADAFYRKDEKDEEAAETAAPTPG